MLGDYPDGKYPGSPMKQLTNDLLTLYTKQGVHVAPWLIIKQASRRIGGIYYEDSFTR
jgi:hypothetical protein